MAKSNVSFGLGVNLTVQEATALCGGQASPERLSVIATNLLRQLAGGGIMIPPEWAQRVDEAIHTAEPAAIVEHVEKAVGKQGDYTTVEWLVDPTQIGFYKMQADNAGISLAMQLKAHMDYGYGNGWLGQTAPEPFKILLTPEQYRELQQLFARDIVVGQDIMNALGGVLPAAAEDDLVLETLAHGEVEPA